MTENRQIHQLARKCLQSMKRPGILYERQNLEAIYDFSSNTNPFINGPSAYPDLSCKKVKKTYQQILALEMPNCLADHVPSADEMLVCRGITEGIDLLIRAFCEPGHDTILIPEPTFFMYEYWAKANSVGVEKIPLIGDNYNRVDVDVVRKSQAKLVFLCSPNNPVGSTLKIEHVADLARNTSALVVVDEAYIEFSKEPSCVRLIKEHPNVVVLRTFSKAWGLAGLRCGVAMARLAVIEALTLVQGPFAIGEPTQRMVAGCFENHRSFSEQIATIRSERARVASSLSRSSHVKKVFPSEANFLLVECHNATALHERLLKDGIMVDPAWHLIPNTLRISISRASTNGVLLEKI